MMPTLPSATDFFALTPDRVMGAVEALLGRRSTHCHPLNSLENRVYEVELDDQTRVVAKFYRPGRWTDAQIEEEHTFLADLVAAEVPAVAPLPWPDGRTLRRDPETGIPCALFPRVGGRAPEEFTDGQLERLGILLARVHTVGAARDARHRHVLDVDTYGRASRDVLLSAPSLPPALARPLAAVCDSLFARIDPLFEELTVHRIHGDCHPGNLLWGRNGAFFLDFDDMVTGPAVQDVWMLVPGHDAEARRQRDVLLGAYERFRPFDRRTLRLVEALRVLRYLHHAAWITRRWNDPAFPRVFPHYGEPRYWSELVDDLSEQLARIEAIVHETSSSMQASPRRTVPHDPSRDASGNGEAALGPPKGTVQEVSWHGEAFIRVWALREEVFVDELGYPAETEADADDPKATHLLALDGAGRALGCVRFVQRGGRVVLGRLAVRQAHRRKGIGSALVEAVRERIHGIPLEVLSPTGARTFFEALGFTLEGEATGRDGSPALRMRHVG